MSLMIAHEQGLDVRVVAHGSSSPGRGSEQGALLVLPDSDIQSAADLEGRTVAVNSLESLTEVMVRDAIATEGGDPDAVELVELSLGDMQAALENGDVDAITTFEPFTTIGEQDGARSVYQIFDLTESGRTFIAGYFTSGAFAEENPDLVEAFTAAIGESLDFAEENPDEVRAIVPTYLDLDQSIIDEMAMPLFGSEMDIDGAQELADIVTDYGVLEQPMDVREFFVLPEGAE
ncbi:ABC-type nitrate/sulfonate/bicarbonate transport systems periplasmic components-like protein [Actinomycetales bacterium JB111]|nr:ABC-type nitrate/sulfonate/bicarbonate transport systems periplasmic components-like protein [Actinomycetales bacterium JB111]